LEDLNETKNFGWPLASYGEHYDLVPINNFTKKFSPLYKSHTKFNFKEPTFYFKESIGISEVIKNYYTEKEEFFITSLKKKILYVFSISPEQKVNLIKEINIGERIRDIIFDEDSRSYFLYLEDSPKIMMLSKKNN
jgi:glucose/arabinose dehydrogenase